MSETGRHFSFQMHPLASLSQELGPPCCSIIDDSGARNRNEQASVETPVLPLMEQAPVVLWTQILSSIHKVDTYNIYLESCFGN